MRVPWLALNMMLALVVGICHRETDRRDQSGASPRSTDAGGRAESGGRWQSESRSDDLLTGVGRRPVGAESPTFSSDNSVLVC